jgi:hypothetical protein
MGLDSFLQQQKQSLTSNYYILPASDLCYADYRRHTYVQHFHLYIRYTIRATSDPALLSD